jgi:polysaccharide export outer membrane protein
MPIAAVAFLVLLAAQDKPAAPPADYVVGVEDVLTITFWDEPKLSGDVIVRPDGMITLPWQGDIQAAGLPPAQLAERVTEAAKLLKYPNVTITLKELRSRKVFITGAVAKPGPYVLSTPLTVMQLIAIAGGVGDFAKRKEITVLRVHPDGKTESFRFNYEEVARGRNLKQNIALKPGDTVIVP